VMLSALGKHIELHPNFIGEHNYANAAGAAAAAHAAGCTHEAIQKGLNAFQPVSGRLQIALNTPLMLLINDSYNANPDSVNAASKVLGQQAGSTLLVLGDMGEWAISQMNTMLKSVAMQNRSASNTCMPLATRPRTPYWPSARVQYISKT
jgi:UDP-N-acetylmuramyl pentapeptide synthase